MISIIEVSTIIIFIGVIVYLWLECKKLKNFYFWENWSKKKHNFALKYKGKIIWYSRSCATTLLAYGFDKNKKLHVLANQRGKGCPDFNGFWNVISGYCEFDVSGEENCVKECKEETGIEINPQDITFVGATTSPSENRQNISLRYITVLPKPIEDYKFDLSNMEKNEVAKVKFIPIDEIANYEWAFNHDKLIAKYSSNIEVK